MRLPIIAALAATSLVACNQAPTPADHSTADSVVREAPTGLTQTYAEFRAIQVNDVRYGLTIELDPVLPEFVGENQG